MLRTLTLVVAGLATTLILTPTAHAKGCADYIKVCARPNAASTGGGGDSPFYTVNRDPITHLPTGTKSCRSGCDHIDPGDRTLGD
jgi:hypothetical protein